MAANVEGTMVIEKKKIKKMVFFLHLDSTRYLSLQLVPLEPAHEIPTEVISLLISTG